MKLIIFDIDGTIIDSIAADDRCFIQTYKELYQIDLKGVDWNDFINVTDTGLSIEIFEKFFERKPTEDELLAVKNHFKGLLSQYVSEYKEIDGALSFINELLRHGNIEIAFATGGWRETAELKCNTIGLNLNDFIIKSSNDHYNRAEIIKLTINEALNKKNLKQFDTVVYFGDGLWDLKTTTELGINFIGVDYKGNNKLRDAGVTNLINNYKNQQAILDQIDAMA